MSKTYSVVKLNNKAETVPYYLDNITLSEVFAYYFNFNPHSEGALIEEISKWFAEKRGWTWQEIG